MLRTVARALYVAVFVPISIYRRLTASSRYGARFHRGPSAWDRPVAGSADR